MTYDRVNWQNEPSENTPLSAENLNKMDSAIKELSEMVEANPVEADTDELKKIGIEGTIYKIAGGHELVNSSGSTMTQRSKMEFLDTHLTDDSGNNTTKVQVTKEITTAQFSSETEEGLYFITDMPDSVVTAEQVAYDSNNSVKDMLNPTVMKKLLSNESFTANTQKQLTLSEEYVKYKFIVFRTTYSENVTVKNDFVIPSQILEGLRLVGGQTRHYAYINSSINGEILFIPTSNDGTKISINCVPYSGTIDVYGIN